MIFNRFDLDMQQNVTFKLQLNITDANTNPINLSGYSATMYIKPSYNSNTIITSLSTANGEIQIANTGTYILTLPASRTANVWVDMCNGNPPKSTYVYDMNITDGTGLQTKIIFGNVNFYGSITK